MDSYIKMCEEAKEIQKLWRPHSCDYYYDKFSGTKKFVTNYDLSDPKMYDYLIKNKNYIWLPIQKQLQEMLKVEAIKSAYDYKDRPIVALYWTFQWWFEKRAGESYIRILQDSYEKLWLGCLMYMKYKKIWNEKKNEWEIIK